MECKKHNWSETGMYCPQCTIDTLTKKVERLEQHHHITETAIGVARLNMKIEHYASAKKCLDDCCNQLDLLDKQALAAAEKE